MVKSLHAEFVERTGQLPQLHMHAAIAELAGSGEAALAAELEELRQRWSRAVRRRMQACPPGSARKRLEDVLLRLEAALELREPGQASAAGCAAERRQAHAAVAGLRAEGEGNAAS
jgi:hypothetical protein